VEDQGHAGGRTSAVRVYLLTYFRASSTEAGHAAAGHGTESALPPKGLGASKVAELAW
jgi:hypothetical protein